MSHWVIVDNEIVQEAEYTQHIAQVNGKGNGIIDTDHISNLMTAQSMTEAQIITALGLTDARDP